MQSVSIYVVLPLFVALQIFVVPLKVRADTVPYGNVGATDGFNKKLLQIEELRSIQISVYELEDKLFGSQNYQSSGTLGELENCAQSLGKGGTDSNSFEWTGGIYRPSSTEGEFKLTFSNYELFLNRSDLENETDRLRFGEHLKKLKTAEQGIGLKLIACRLEIASRNNLDKQMLANSRLPQSLDISGFEPFINSFIEDAKAIDRKIVIGSLKIKFGDPKQSGCVAHEGFTVYGCCSRSKGKIPLITIDEDRWKKGNRVEHERLIYHELAHCILNRPHVNQVENKEPSLMLPVLDKNLNSYYVKHRMQFIKELFGVGSGSNASNIESSELRSTTTKRSK